jgi:16S rRNA processing protein RimM
MKPDEFDILLGYVTGAHGLKGEAELKLFSELETQLGVGDQVYLFNKETNNGKLFKIENIFLKGKIRAKFENILDRTMLERMLPLEIWTKRQWFKAPKTGEYYIVDLVGINVVTVTGKNLGIIKSFYENGAQTIIVIRGDSEELEIPFVKAFIEKVDLENKLLTVKDWEVIE